MLDMKHAREHIPGFDQMTREQQRQAILKHETEVAAQWEKVIPGYTQLNFWERARERNKWNLEQQAKADQAAREKEINDFKAQAQTIADEQTRRTEAIQAHYAARMAEMQRKQEEQQRAANNLQAMYKARANALSNPQKSAYAGEEAQGGGGEEGGVGATLLTHRGITGGQKLGGKSKLGGKTLLGV